MIPHEPKELAAAEMIQLSQKASAEAEKMRLLVKELAEEVTILLS
jgi:hypothetical protein